MKVCISVKEEVINNLDTMLSMGLFPAYVSNRSSAISYLITKANSDILEPALDTYDRNFPKF